MNVRDVFLDWAEGCYGPGDYEPIMRALGMILVEESSADYQGDTLALIKSPEGKYGVLQFGWGSCSGCDALQACSSWEDLQELCDEMEQSVRWHDSLREVQVAVSAKDWEGTYAPELNKAFIDKVLAVEE